MHSHTLLWRQQGVLNKHGVYGEERSWIIPTYDLKLSKLPAAAAEDMREYGAVQISNLPVSLGHVTKFNFANDDDSLFWKEEQSIWLAPLEVVGSTSLEYQPGRAKVKVIPLLEEFLGLVFINLTSTSNASSSVVRSEGWRRRSKARIQQRA